MAEAVEPQTIEVTVRGELPEHGRDELREYARAKVAQALAATQEPVLRTHVVLGRHPDPAVPRPHTAEATVSVGGHTLRAHAAAPRMTEAVDELEARLRERLVRARERLRNRHRRPDLPTGHEWRHGDLPRRPEPWFPRPAAERQVVRRKSYAAAELTLEEALDALELLDHDFFLYVDATTRTPAVVRRREDGGYAVQGGDEQAAAGAVERVVVEPPPATLTDEQARERLDLGDGVDGDPFVFYLDAGTGRGRVLYHRYDGHYGLIVLE